MRTTEELLKDAAAFKSSRFYTTEPGYKWVSNLVDELATKVREREERVDFYLVNGTTNPVKGTLQTPIQEGGLISP